MVNIETLWKHEGFEVDNPSLRALAADFKARRADPSSPLYTQRDNLVDWCAEAQSLAHAVSIAVESIRPNGKKHNHQSRVPTKVLAAYKRRLLLARRRIGNSRGFDNIYAICAELAPIGVGPVTMYDVATRIAAKKGFEPTIVYLHAGVRAGARSLLGAEAVRGKEFLRLSEFPYPLREWPADEVEDFTCTYRDAFGRMNGRARP